MNMTVLALYSVGGLMVVISVFGMTILNSVSQTYKILGTVGLSLMILAVVQLLFPIPLYVYALGTLAAGGGCAALMEYVDTTNIVFRTGAIVAAAHIIVAAVMVWTGQGGVHGL